ncbi:MAG TPA: glycosyltransferase family 2 protein, partial [Acidobacteriota bacterium]
GELLLFLNNDTEFLQPDGLDRMAQWFDREKVAIVGAKLLYPGERIQHAGVIVGMGGLASHLFLNEREEIRTIFGFDVCYRNLSAVTGACLMIARAVFEELGGFDEEFQLNYSDVDLCLRARQLEYRVVYTPDARLLHHESATHKRRIPRSDFELASKKWQDWLRRGDPFFNENLSYRNSMPSFRGNRKECSQLVNIELMKRIPQKDILLLPDDLA